MEASFWTESWDLGGTKTSFHYPAVHPYVLAHLPPERLAGKRVLVPLCGKTMDMAYFRTHAVATTGVELVEKAIHQFSAEQEISFTRRGNRFEADRLTIICGDFLSLTQADVGHVDLAYDRAALIALPLPMRMAYVQKMHELLPIGSQLFINTLEYAPTMGEPPFSVSPEEIAEYYGARFAIEHVEKPERPEHRMVEKFNLRFLKEHGFLLTRVR